MDTKHSRTAILFLSIFLSIVIFLPSMGRISAIIWEEDFENGLGDWQLSGFTIPDFASSPGNFTTADGVLRISGNDSLESIAERSSSQATGTWSFDLDVTDSPRDHFYIPFFGEKTGNLSEGINPPYQYGVVVVTGSIGSWHSEFVFYRRNKGDTDVVKLESFTPENILGWHHFDITRNTEGEFNIYLNGSLCASFQDTKYNTTEVFGFSGGNGPGIDNIVVRDNIQAPQSANSSSFGFLALSLLFLTLYRIERKRKKIQ